MNKAQEIIEILGSESVSLVNALIKAQILAAKVGEPDFVQWVKNELLGYPDNAELPEYRRLVATVQGTVTNGVRRINEFGLPIGHLTEDQRAAITRRNVQEGIAEVEAWVGRNDLVHHLPPELTAIVFREGLDPSFHVERAWTRLSVGAVEGLLVQIRSRLLEFALEVEKVFPVEDREISVAVSNGSGRQFSDIFHDTIFGDNATIQIGFNNSASIENSVRKNDIDSLSRALKDAGVSESDVNDLEIAIRRDGDRTTDGSLGSSVKTWLSKMLERAISGAWQVGINAASGLLGAALGAYYGFPV